MEGGEGSAKAERKRNEMTCIELGRVSFFFSSLVYAWHGRHGRQRTVWWVTVGPYRTVQHRNYGGMCGGMHIGKFNSINIT
jgi:hypothetical protein